MLCSQCIWKRLYNASSVSDGGTLYQLRNLINRRNVNNDPSHNVTPSEDFILTVLDGYIVNAAMNIFKMESCTDVPYLLPETTVNMNESEKTEIILQAPKKLVASFVDIAFNETKNKNIDDGVYSYTCEVISLGLLLNEFNDAIREGDGRRILRCWKFFLPIFKACDRKNYAIEAFNLLCQYHFWFTQRMAAQLMWSRTVNTTGKPGKNISCDLHMEHLNRNVKCAIAGLSSNVSEEPVQRVGKCNK